MVGERKPGGTVLARGGLCQPGHLRRLLAAGALVDEQPVGGDEARQARRELRPVEVVRRIAEDEVVRAALGGDRAQDVLAEHDRAQAELVEVRVDRPAGRPVGFDEDDLGGAARERLETQRARAGEQVEHARVVDRPDQVEGVLANAVRGRPVSLALRRGDSVPAVRAGDDPHGRSMVPGTARVQRRPLFRQWHPACAAHNHAVFRTAPRVSVDDSSHTR